MKDSIIEHAERLQCQAHEVIRELKIIEIWKAYGAQARLVGSLSTGLLIKKRDIDFHVYSERFSISDSFGAIALIASNRSIKKVTYNNLIDTEEKCIEWHLWFLDEENNEWQIDIIHIHNESPYAGKFENVAERIKTVLTPELKLAILSIKNEIPDTVKVMGIEVYQAVIRDGIRNYNDFMLWREKNHQEGIIDWMP
ncbi:MAG: phosphoglycerate mutase family protein [Bacteroidales bacterium]|nr:phosphoglycerate mutase family protein [Bacteroidales bacterium]